MKALVLSGGGVRGAYQCGVLQYLLGDLKLKYDILCGVSVGAINCAFLSMFSAGEESSSIEQLTAWWMNINNSKIYKRWEPFGRLHSLWKKSFYDSSPLHELVNGCLDINRIRSSGKNVAVGTLSLSSGQYSIFDQNSDHFINAVLASAAFPGMLAPVKFLDQIWADGGLKELSPLKTAIEMGATEIDAIITTPEIRVKRFLKNPTTVDILKRSFDLSADKITQNDIEKVQMHNKLADAGLSDYKNIKLNILRPNYNLIEDLFDFRPEKIKEMIKKGYQDAKYKYIM